MILRNQKQAFSICRKRLSQELSRVSQDILPPRILESSFAEVQTGYHHTTGESSPKTFVHRYHTHTWDIQNIPNPMVLTGCALIHSNSWNFLISQAWYSPRQDMEDLFHYLDVDGTGTLSQNEFIEGRLMAACRTLLAHDYLTTEWTYLEICVAYTRKSVLIPRLQYTWAGETRQYFLSKVVLLFGCVMTTGSWQHWEHFRMCRVGVEKVSSSRFSHDRSNLEVLNINQRHIQRWTCSPPWVASTWSMKKKYRK